MKPALPDLRFPGTLYEHALAILEHVRDNPWATFGRSKTLLTGERLEYTRVSHLYIDAEGSECQDSIPAVKIYNSSGKLDEIVKSLPADSL